MKLSDLQPRAEEILQRYEQPRAAMLPMLWLVQENFGYVSQEAEAWVASILGVARVQVREVVSFYNMFHTSPVGRREIRVCTSLPCSTRALEMSSPASTQFEGRLSITGRVVSAATPSTEARGCSTSRKRFTVSCSIAAKSCAAARATI